MLIYTSVGPEWRFGVPKPYSHTEPLSPSKTRLLIGCLQSAPLLSANPCAPFITEGAGLSLRSHPPRRRATNQNNRKILTSQLHQWGCGKHTEYGFHPSLVV